MPLLKRSKDPTTIKKNDPITQTQEHSPMPAYSAAASSEMPASSPDITAAFSNLKLGPTTNDFPNPDQCLAHLKLLEAFHQLREDVALRDGLFGIMDSFVPDNLGAEKHAEILMKIREKRWAVYVAKSVQRFQAWWTLCVQPHAQKLSQSQMENRSFAIPEQGDKLSFEPNSLPPPGKCDRMDIVYNY